MTQRECGSTFLYMAMKESCVQNFDPRYSLEQRTNFLLNALNGLVSKELVYDRARLNELVSRIRDLNAIWSDPKQRYEKATNEQVISAAAAGAWDAVEDLLGRYSGSPTLTGFQSSSDADHIFVLEWRRRNNRPHTDMALALTVIELLQAEKIDSLRPCDECKGWILARFPHQRFCSSECKDQFHTSNEADKARRREWARANYQSRKELELGSRKAAQRKGTK